MQVFSKVALSQSDLISKYIAIWSREHQRFMQMDESGLVGVLEDQTVTPENIEAWRTWERFEVVDAGDGKIAFYNPNSKRFLRVDGNEVNSHGGKIQDSTLPAGFESERFTVVDVGNGTVAFHNACHNRFIRMKNRKVDARGGPMNADQLPLEWGAEQWEIVLHPFHSSRSNHPEAAAVVAASSSAIVAGAVPLAAIGCVQAVGFSGGGIIAGSTAAAMMSAEAIAAGGSIAAGGTVATLQSVGAVGFSSVAAVGGIVVMSVGGAALLSYGLYRGVESFTKAPYLSDAPKKQSFPHGKVAIKAPNGRFLVALGGGHGNWFFDMMAKSCYTGVVKAEAEHAN